MDNCPKCKEELVTDYDMEEEPYLLCSNCGWYEEKEENSVCA